MAASTNDYFKKVGDATVTTLAAPGKALGANSITVGATTNYPTDTGVVIAIRAVDTAGELVAGTYTEWSATATSGTTFAVVATPVYGNDQVYAAGSTTQVYIGLSKYAHNTLIDGLLVAHDQDGTLKAGAVDNTAVLASDVVTTTKILDGNVTYAKTDGKIWWEEIGRTTLSVAGDTITVSSLPARKYLQIQAICLATGGTISAGLTFNGDTGANYALTRMQVDNAGTVTGASAGSQSAIGLQATVVANNKMFSLEVVNIATSEKSVVGTEVNMGNVGASTTTALKHTSGKWSNTVAQISSVTLTNAGTGDYAIGSEVVVLGHN